MTGVTIADDQKEPLFRTIGRGTNQLNGSPFSRPTPTPSYAGELRVPWAREITAHQKHRVKQLRRQPR